MYREGTENEPYNNYVHNSINPYDNSSNPYNDTPFSPTEQTVQLQYPSNQSIPKPVTSFNESTEMKPAVASSSQPVITTTEVRDKKSTHLPHLHLPTIFHRKDDPIHSVNEDDRDGFKAEKSFLWSCIGSICLCLCGCWCIPWIPFVIVHSQYMNSTSERARRYSHLAKITWIVIVISLVSILLLGVVIAVVVPSVYSRSYRRQL